MSYPVVLPRNAGNGIKIPLLSAEVNKDADFAQEAAGSIGDNLTDEDSSYADGVLAALETLNVLVTASWLLEIANVLLVAERKRRRGKAFRIHENLFAICTVDGIALCHAEKEG